jgi:hypothetical protein
VVFRGDGHHRKHCKPKAFRICRLRVSGQDEGRLGNAELRLAAFSRTWFFFILLLLLSIGTPVRVCVWSVRLAPTANSRQECHVVPGSPRIQQRKDQNGPRRGRFLAGRRTREKRRKRKENVEEYVLSICTCVCAALGWELGWVTIAPNAIPLSFIVNLSYTTRTRPVHEKPSTALL